MKKCIKKSRKKNPLENIYKTFLFNQKKKKRITIQARSTKHYNFQPCLLWRSRGNYEAAYKKKTQAGQMEQSNKTSEHFKY